MQKIWKIFVMTLISVGFMSLNIVSAETQTENFLLENLELELEISDDWKLGDISDTAALYSKDDLKFTIDFPKELVEMYGKELNDLDDFMEFLIDLMNQADPENLNILEYQGLENKSDELNGFYIIYEDLNVERIEHSLFFTFEEQLAHINVRGSKEDPETIEQEFSAILESLNFEYDEARIQESSIE